MHVAAGLLRDYLGRVRQHSSSGLRVYVHRAPQLNPSGHQLVKAGHDLQCCGQALSSNAMIILYNMPPIGILGSLTEEPTESVSKRQWEHGFFPNKDLIWCCMLIRVGLGMTVITGVLPDLAKGVTPLASVGLLSLTKLHLGGITLGIGLVLIGITWYVVMSPSPSRYCCGGICGMKMLTGKCSSMSGAQSIDATMSMTYRHRM